MSNNGLHHNLIPLPQGKNATDFISERHEIVLLFDATKANPNGDPDAGNMPRLQPDSLKGLVTDVCLKRKIRNFFSLYTPDGSPLTNQPADGYRIFVKENAIFKDHLDDVHQRMCRIQFGKLIEDMKAGGYLDEQAVGDIEKTVRFDLFPDKPKEVAKFVLENCKGKLNFASLLTEVCQEMETYQELSLETKEKLKAIQLSDDDKKSEDKLRKAFTDAAKKAAGKGEAKTVEGILKLCFDKCSPQSQIEKNFAELELEKLVREYACKDFIDNRTFGCVISTKGPLEGSFYGQVRGPVQITFAESLDRVLQLDATITRCAVASKEEIENTGSTTATGGNRTFGRKHIIDYGLYRAHIYVSAAFAHKTGFTYHDLDNFLFALKHMFQDDNAAGRTGLRVVGLIDFQHATCLGNAPAHKLFEKVVVEKKNSEQEFPGRLEDYQGEAPADGVVLEEGEGENKRTLVTAKRLAWEIPQKLNTAAQGSLL